MSSHVRFLTSSHVVNLPPGNLGASQSFYRLVHAGIFQRWMIEEDGLLCFKRVQDRVRFVSITNIKEIEDNSPIALKLPGKTLTIFLLGIISILVPYVAFFVELALTVWQGWWFWAYQHSVWVTQNGLRGFKSCVPFEHGCRICNAQHAFVSIFALAFY